MRHWQSGTMIRRFCTDAGWTTTGTPGARSPACRKSSSSRPSAAVRRTPSARRSRWPSIRICTRSIYRAYTNTRRTATPACSAAATTTASRRTFTSRWTLPRPSPVRGQGTRASPLWPTAARSMSRTSSTRWGISSPATTPATTPGRSAHRAWRACSTR